MPSVTPPVATGTHHSRTELIKALNKVLHQAKGVALEQIQKNIITMNYQVRIKESENLAEMEINIVYSKNAHLPKG
ncbi:MAG: hypothetical protein M3142_01855 [Bacteroidota bacterium]|nr:hypothetical protein [Bacteroidota bacterium]